MTQRTGEYHRYESVVPVGKDDPRRAKDFVKCEDPKCPINARWADRCKRFGWTADDYQPHCHPVF